MPTADIVRVADAVRAELATAALSLPFTPTRTYLPRHDLPDLAALAVTVVAASLTTERVARGQVRHVVAVDVAIQQQTDPTDTAAIDALMLFAQEIAAALEQRRLAACPAAVWMQTAQLPLYDVEHLEQHHVTTAVVRVTYRLME